MMEDSTGMEILNMCHRAKNPARALEIAIDIATEILTRSNAGESNKEIELALATKYEGIRL